MTQQQDIVPADADVPLFPLSTVLFPGGLLPLRVFEARYMDMVRDCMQRDQPFGVCLITRGGEVGEPAEHESIGCLARITDWDMKQLGLLLIRSIGTQRFRILDRRVGKGSLLRATIETLPEDPRLPVPPEFAACALLAQRLTDEVEQREPDPAQRPIVGPYDFESAAWVANRLAEFLPIEAGTRQRLMVLEDPVARLALVHRFLEQHQVI